MPYVRDQLGEYTSAWYTAGLLSVGAAVLSLMLLGRRGPVAAETPVEPARVATKPRAWSYRG